MKNKVLAGIAAAGLLAAGVVVNEVVDKSDDSSTAVTIAAYEDGIPAFTNGQWYCWTPAQGALASNALVYLNTNPLLPLTGSDVNGNPRPDKQKTTSWHPQVETKSDGEFCFPRIPEKTLDYMGVPAENRTNFFNVFQPHVEMYGGTNWFPGQ